MNGIPFPPPQDITIRVLVVCDGYDKLLFSFSKVTDTTDTYFTLTKFVTTLREFNNDPSALGVVRFNLTLAHRDNDLGVGDKTHPNLLDGTVVNAWFNWKGSPAVPSGKTGVDLSHFDVIYMFGFNSDQSAGSDSGTNLCWDGKTNEDQLCAFVQFMNAGGGIFATGDHEDRGAALCGSIPRVRSMRRWWWDTTNPNNDTYTGPGDEGPYGSWNYGISFVFSQPVAHPFNRDPYKQLGDLCSPPAVGPYRLDTVQPGPKGLEAVLDVYTHTSETGVPFDRQSDDIPQPLTVTTQHPILALGNNRYLSHLPDHMHEGLVIGTNDADRWGPMPAQQTFVHRGTTIAEYPKTAKGIQPLPMVIAQVLDLPHVTPSGEEQHVGALDPSFYVHHGAISVYDGRSVNVGRIVTQTSFHHFVDINLLGDPVTWVSGGTNRRGFTTAAGQAYMSDFELYWINLTVWLAPARLKLGMMLGALDKARRNSSIRMVSRPEMNLSGHAVHDIGQMVAQRLDAEFPTPMLQDMVECSLDPEHHAAISAVLADRRRAVPNAVNQLQRVFLHGFLGGAMLHALEYPATTSLQAESDAIHPKVVSAGLHGAGRSLAVSQHRAVVPDLVETLHKFGG